MSRCWIGEYTESLEQEAWRGYEFWSAQMEAEMELIEEEGAAAARLARQKNLFAAGQQARFTVKAPQEGAGDVLPF